MSSFRFNFQKDDEEENRKVTETAKVQWFECQEIKPNNKLNDFDSIVAKARIFTCNEVEIGHVVASEALSNMKNSNTIKLAEDQHSDLIAGHYEGGLKIWECTGDLIKYLEENKQIYDMQNKKVLDLGCGTGLLGIYAFMNEATVTFQDYNKEVVEHVTIPNVILNIEEEERAEKLETCKFFSGDWAHFNKKLEDSDTFDVILSSETIYNIDNYQKLIEIILKRLSDIGVAFVAAKTYYFGVGGGVKQFETAVENTGSLNCDVCWKSTGGIQREILKITRKLTT